jgi:CBS domain-containing protein
MTSVRELMVPLEEYSHVAAGTSLRDVIKTLAQAMMGPAPDPSRPRDRGILVQAPDGSVIGKLSLWDLLNGLRPAYEPPIDPFGRVDDHLLWSQWLRADLAERARSIRAEDLLKKPVKDETIEETAPLDLAVHRMVRARRLSLLVTRGDAIIGVLRLSDVFKAVNRMISAAEKQPAPA